MAITGSRIGAQGVVRETQDTSVRVTTMEKRGVYFNNPVSLFKATVGAANTGAQITFQISSAKGVQQLQLLRNVSKDPGSAKVLTTYQTSPQSAGDAYANQTTTYHDSDPSTFGKTVFYFLKVLPLHTKFVPYINGPVQVSVP